MTPPNASAAGSPPLPASLRAARPHEAAALVDRIRSAIPPEALPLTPIGQQGAPEWVADQIRDSSAHPVPRFVTTDPSLAGVAEWRRIDDALFLNQIYVAPEARTQGLATRLLLHALRRVPASTLVRLDVFPSSGVALDWYRRLGFSETGRRCWMTLPVAPSGPDVSSDSRAVVQNRERADATHARYGFSRIEVQLDSGAVASVGRLGSSYFRITVPHHLHDRSLRTTLHRLDAGRQVLYVGPVPEAVPPRAEVVAQSIRHEAPAGSLLARLTAESPSDVSA